MQIKSGLTTALVLATVLITSACTATRTQRTAGETIDDSVLTGKVKVALIGNENTKAGQINIETHRGIVQLSGFVATDAEKAAAGRVARSIEGVQEVRNDIEVRRSVASNTAGDEIDDAALTASVKAALIGNETTKARDINVETQMGVVQLSGFVDNNEQKAAATRVASSVSGVKEVRNDLQIKQN